jgi:hypothetical protein
MRVQLLLLLVRMMIRTPLFDRVKSLVKSNSPKQAGTLAYSAAPGQTRDTQTKFEKNYNQGHERTLVAPILRI